MISSRATSTRGELRAIAEHCIDQIKRIEIADLTGFRATLRRRLHDACPSFDISNRLGEQIMNWDQRQMALEVAGLFHRGASVNLGIGLPTLVAELISPDMELMLHSENGILGVGGRPARSEVSATLINAGKETITAVAGASYFDSALSFGMIRGGHIDFCVLGGMEVDVQGNLANWMIPGQKVTGMGGAMDLVNGAKCVIVMLTHENKAGVPKLVDRCKLPLTGAGVVNTIVTDKGVFEPKGDHFSIRKLAPGVLRDSLNSSADLFREQ